MDHINIYLEDKQKTYQYLAGMMADYLTIAEDICMRQLRQSNSFQKNERANKIYNLKNEKKKLIKENKILTYEL
jgi:hypothetical protein